LAVKLVSKISNLCDHNPPKLQKNGRTDTKRSQYRAMHYSASRSKKRRDNFLNDTVAYICRTLGWYPDKSRSS